MAVSTPSPVIQAPSPLGGRSVPPDRWRWPPPRLPRATWRVSSSPRPASTSPVASTGVKGAVGQLVHAGAGGQLAELGRSVAWWAGVSRNPTVCPLTCRVTGTRPVLDGDRGHGVLHGGTRRRPMGVARAAAGRARRWRRTGPRRGHGDLEGQRPPPPAAAGVGGGVGRDEVGDERPDDRRVGGVDQLDPDREDPGGERPHCSLAGRQVDGEGGRGRRRRRRSRPPTTTGMASSTPPPATAGSDAERDGRRVADIGCRVRGRQGLVEARTGSTGTGRRIPPPPASAVGHGGRRLEAEIECPADGDPAVWEEDLERAEWRGRRRRPGCPPAPGAAPDGAEVVTRATTTSAARRRAAGRSAPAGVTARWAGSGSLPVHVEPQPTSVELPSAACSPTDCGPWSTPPPTCRTASPVGRTLALPGGRFGARRHRARTTGRRPAIKHLTSTSPPTPAPTTSRRSSAAGPTRCGPRGSGSGPSPASTAARSTRSPPTGPRPTSPTRASPTWRSATASRTTCPGATSR